MKFRIHRYDPDKDAKPYFQDYDLQMGPADRMLLSLGHESSARGVARIYRGIATAFVLDTIDADLEPQIAELGMQTLVIDTVMGDHLGRARLARDVLEFAGVAVR